MAGKAEASTKPRVPLNREQVLRAGMDLADKSGIEGLSMRKLGRELGVEAMSLYNHVAGKDDLLYGMVDLIWAEVTPPPPRGDWRTAIGKTALSAHKLLVRHPWACNLTITSGRIHPARMRYIDAILGRLTKADLPAELIYYAYHAIDSHIIGFTMWDNAHVVGADRRAQLAPQTDPPVTFDNLSYLAEHVRQHRKGFGRSGVNEFSFVLGLILDGIEQARVKR
jgi:AcrR family transcriptional regulator